MSDSNTVTLLDYGAGNVRSIRNAIISLGYQIKDVVEADDIINANRLIFPGVGSFAAAMNNLKDKGYFVPLQDYIKSGRPFFGICIGLQALFEWSTEGDVEGLGILPGRVEKFNHQLPIPHIGWNSLSINQQNPEKLSSSKSTGRQLFSGERKDKFYFVHSYRVLPTPSNFSYVSTLTDYGERFISSIHYKNILATQFHPEKSSLGGLNIIKSFLKGETDNIDCSPLIRNSQISTQLVDKDSSTRTELSKRIIACLDVRSNDVGDLVVTKGDQYDVRDINLIGESGKGSVRNLGKPVDLARTYYEAGADEITFLNITSFRAEPLSDTPMLEVLKQTSTSVFVPLCVGGGIRDYIDTDGVKWSALRVADEYFRSGADKISIGSDAVVAAEEFYKNGQRLTGLTSIEQISRVYGAQAVVVSIDPKRIYVRSPTETNHAVIKSSKISSKGEEYCWYQCTIKGGREVRDLDVCQLALAVESLGAGELLINSLDEDGQKGGYDYDLINQISQCVHLPVIASSGAGKVEHFSSVFEKTNVSAALAAGIFHRKEVTIQQVKKHLEQQKIPVRI